MASTSVRAGDREVPVEVFEPPEGTPTPRAGVLVIHESYGLNDDIRRLARRFASNGYVAAAPDVLTGGPKLLCVARAMRELAAGEGRTVAALEAVLDMLAA